MPDPALTILTAAAWPPGKRLAVFKTFGSSGKRTDRARIGRSCGLFGEDLTRAAFWAGDYRQAKKYAQDWLKASEELEKEPLPSTNNERVARKLERGQAIHDANMILGEIALSEGKVKEAAQFLVEAGKATDGLTLTSYGPDLALANDLLDKGERQAVLTFFEECRASWKIRRGSPSTSGPRLSRPARNRTSARVSNFISSACSVEN